MFREIRSMMDEGEPGPLRGLVEVDETFIGGRKHGQGRGAVGDEWAYRFNHRHDEMPMFWSMLGAVAA